jgi:hypothetical protein
MNQTPSHVTVRFVLRNGEPYIESRFRAIDAVEDGPIPKGKILVIRAPLHTSGGGEAEMEEEFIDDDGSAEAFCPECAAAGHDPDAMLQVLKSGTPFGGKRKCGRNDPCPCGSGKKYKRCCLN